MSFLSYGKTSLIRCETVGHDQEAMYDGPSYLYTRHTLTVRFLLNTVVNSYVAAPQQPDPVDRATGLPGNAGLVPVPPQSQGQPGIVTQNAVQENLMLPRQALLYRTGDPVASVLDQLISPPGSTIDPRNLNATALLYDCTDGPRPLYLKVVGVHGVKTLMMEYSIQTDINEAFLYRRTPPVILSHLWRMTHSIGPDFMTTRRVVGRAIFNVGQLANISATSGGAYVATPDSYRAFLFHPIPVTFQRTEIEVTATEGGEAIEYSYVDVEQPYVVLNLEGTNGNPVKIEAIHSATLTRPNLEDVLGTGPSQLLAKTADVLRGRSFDLPLGFTTVRVHPLEWAADALDAMAGFKFLPSVQHVIATRIWGNRQAFRSNLASVGMNIVNDRLATLIINLGPRAVAGWASNITHDIMGRYVEVSGTFRTGPLVTALSRGPAIVGVGGFTYPVMPGVDTIAGVTAEVGVAPRPRGDFTSRGTYLGQCMANMLAEPNQLYSEPQDPNYPVFPALGLTSLPGNSYPYSLQPLAEVP